MENKIKMKTLLALGEKNIVINNNFKMTKQILYENLGWGKSFSKIFSFSSNMKNLKKPLNFAESFFK